MSYTTKTRVTTGLAAIVSGAMLAGSSGLTFVCGWTVWFLGLVALMSAVPRAGERLQTRRVRRPRAAKRYSLVP